jgi:hypothetical protein
LPDVRARRPLGPAPDAQQRLIAHGDDLVDLALETATA